MTKKMQILVTGGAGYIGSVLVSELLKGGHKVRCLDRFFFGSELMAEVATENPRLELLRDDIRWFNPKILSDVDIVMDLAALSNDPSGELDQSMTFDINYLGRSRVARLSREQGVKRYILASSCSVYGVSEGLLDETSDLNPVTTYAKANRRAEEDILPLATSDFTVSILRFATVYGYSPRMRFDLAINAMVLSLYKHRKIPLMKDGTQWRPFIHIKDAASAYTSVIKASPNDVNGEIFNVGSDDQNYQIFQLAQLVGNSLHLDYEVEWYGDKDERSYHVSFRKFRDTTRFNPLFTPEEGAQEIFEALKSGKLRDSPKTRTVEWYKYLIESYRLVSDVTMRNTLF
jgi:nucleoside-diphosphate-sugar epimerase